MILARGLAPLPASQRSAGMMRLGLIAAATLSIVETAIALPEPSGGQLFAEIEAKVVQSCLKKAEGDICQSYLHGLAKGMGVRCKWSPEFFALFVDTLNKLKSETQIPASNWKNMDQVANRHLYKWCPEGFPDAPMKWKR